MTAQSANQDRKRALERNENLAQRALRWSRFRLAFTVVFLAAGCAIALTLRSLAISFPLFAMSVLFLILYLDASGQVREIRRRSWKTLHPAMKTGAHPTDAAGQRSAEPDNPNLSTV